MRCTDCNFKVQPVVGLDIDGTLARYHQHFVDFCIHYFGRIFEQTEWDGWGEFSDHLGLAKPEYREAKLAYRQGGWKRWMPAYPGAKELVEHLHRQDVEVWLLTTRPWLRLDNIDPDTREWCRRNSIEFDYMLFGEDKYDQLLQRVEMERVVAIVDDDPKLLHDARELGLPWIWRKHEFNSGHIISPWVENLHALDGVLTERIMEWKEHYGNG